MTTGLGHAAFAAHDVEKTPKFYGMLGLDEAFRLHRDDDGSLMLVYLHVAGVRFIEVLPCGPPPNPGRVGSFMHVCLLMDDVHAPIDAEPTIGLDGNWQVWTHGPDGNRIELMQISEGSPRWWAAHSAGEHET